MFRPFRRAHPNTTQALATVLGPPTHGRIKRMYWYVRNGLQNMWAELKPRVANAWQGVQPFMAWLGQALRGGFMTVWSKIWTGAKWASVALVVTVALYVGYNYVPWNKIWSRTETAQPASKPDVTKLTVNKKPEEVESPQPQAKPTDPPKEEKKAEVPAPVTPAPEVTGSVTLSEVQLKQLIKQEVKQQVGAEVSSALTARMPEEKSKPESQTQPNSQPENAAKKGPVTAAELDILHRRAKEILGPPRAESRKYSVEIKPKGQSPREGCEAVTVKRDGEARGTWTRWTCPPEP